jgi:hypothetical protein
MAIFVFFPVNYCNRGSEKFSWPNVVTLKFEICKVSKIMCLCNCFDTFGFVESSTTMLTARCSGAPVLVSLERC